MILMSSLMLRAVTTILAKLTTSQIAHRLPILNSFIYSSPHFTCHGGGRGRIILVLKDGLKVNSSLRLCPNACHSSHFISSLRSGHCRKGECSTRYFERDHTHIAFTTAYYHNSLFIISYWCLLLCPIYKSHFIIGICGYRWYPIGKNVGLM